MSRSHLPEPNAILFQLLAELQAYELHIQDLVQDWELRQDVLLFGEPGKSMDRMRTLAAALPQISPHWLMVMISHTELMHNLWRVTRGEPLDVPAEVQDHLAAVTSLATRCRRLVVPGGRVLH